ncbi:MAG: signal peptidase I [Lachnospiraceae bacterium]|nr:signal peptidase I [Lachnospiraceae bacterium]
MEDIENKDERESEKAVDEIVESDEALTKEELKARKKEAKEAKKALKASKKDKRKEKAKKKPEEINIVKELLSLIVYIGIVVLFCFFIINYVGCRSLVDGSSMEPNLHDGDNLWVDKLSYNIGDPKRFDVIVFNYDEDTTYVKRIIGMPGETIRIDQNGNIYINEMMLVEHYGKEVILPTNIGRASQSILLGEDEYFVLGDNRNNSQDSRLASVGNVSREDIVGKAVFRIYPLSDIGIVD